MIARLIDTMVSAIAPERGLRRLAARTRMQMLAAYAAASKDRGRREWNARSTSADRAIVGDMGTLNPRARQLCNDTSEGASIKNAFARKVVGTGITPVAVARDAKGNELRAFNAAVDRWWRLWSRRKQFCDVERKKTIAGFQRLAVRELVTVGQHMVAWSYVQEKDMPGLRLTSFEPEQFDTRSIRNHETGHEIRGGIEVNEFTAPVAYHFYPKHPQDLFPIRLDSVRLEAGRVFHLFDQDRVQQSHGVTWMTPVMNRIRDLNDYDQAQLWKARMEACIGLIRKRDPEYGQAQTGLKAASGSDGVDARGNPEITFEPGMVAETVGEDELKPFVPTGVGGEYDPFVTRQLHATASGGRLSYGQLTRDFTRGTYSGQRQESLEDYAEFDWVMDLVVTDFLEDLWRQFVTILVLEDRVPAPGFFRDPEMYLQVEWQGPPRPWIDPQKEVTAETMALLWKLTTRKRLLNQRGLGLRDTLQQAADERDLFEELELEAPDFGADPQSTPSLGDDAKPAKPGAIETAAETDQKNDDEALAATSSTRETEQCPEPVTC